MTHEKHPPQSLPLSSTQSRVVSPVEVDARPEFELELELEPSPELVDVESSSSVDVEVEPRPLDPEDEDSRPPVVADAEVEVSPPMVMDDDEPAAEVEPISTGTHCPAIPVAALEPYRLPDEHSASGKLQ